MWAVLLLACVAAAAAQTPIACAGPKAFTGHFRHLDRERRYFTQGKIFYDETNRRVREFEERSDEGQKEVLDILRLYNLGIEYRVDLKTMQCNVTTLRRSWYPYGVPPFAKYAGEGTLGAIGVEGEEVTVSLFEGDFDGNPYFVTVTEPDCFPVEMGFYSNTTGYDHREFYDLVEGVTDPEAFIPPKSCV